MRVEHFVRETGAGFFTGVPDSQLKALCDYLIEKYGAESAHHVIAANEGNCAAIAAGYHLATGRVPLIYLQNSGEGNVVNPLASLLNDRVYAIPAILVVGWRGEPGVRDEPQHIFQGEVTLRLLEDMGVATCIIGKDTTIDDVRDAMEAFIPLLKSGKQVAFVVRKGALEYGGSPAYSNENPMSREEIIEHILAVSGDDPIVSTTGKASRELFELREKLGQDHGWDFLTVGSMGHSSSIALGIALQRPECRIWVIDGDGAALMHLGAMAVIGSLKPSNLVHVVVNNGAHESVGGQPTAMADTDIVEIARGCGYPHAISVSTFVELDAALLEARDVGGLHLIEAKSAIGSRADLGRPTTSTRQNKDAFMAHLSKR